MSSSRRFLLASAALFLAGASTGGCTKKPSAIVVALSSEPNIPAEIDTVIIEVDRGDSTPFYRTYDLSDPSTHLPGTLTFQSDPSGDDDTSSITITITASGKVTLPDPTTGKDAPTEATRLIRSATLGFTKEETKLLRMPLRYACLDQYVGQGSQDDGCGSGQTCLGGLCVSDAVDVSTLPELTSIDDVFPALGASGCFDARATTCLASPSVVDLATIMASTDCSAMTGATNGKLNVAVHWVHAEDGVSGVASTIVLDQDPADGWTFTDASKTGFTLTQGICQELKAGHIDQVAYYPSCEPKLSTVPVCQPASATGAGGALDIPSTGAGGAAGAVSTAGGTSGMPAAGATASDTGGAAGGTLMGGGGTGTMTAAGMGGTSTGGTGGGTSGTNTTLLVDNSGSPDTGISAPIFQTLLTNAGLAHDTITLPINGSGSATPTAQQLVGYTTIVWFTGATFGLNAGDATVSATQETTLETWLDQGEHTLFLFSENLVDDLGKDSNWATTDDSLFGTYLGAIGVESSFSSNATGAINMSTISLQGGAGTPFAGLMYQVVGNMPITSAADAVNPQSDANVLLTVTADPANSGTDIAAAVAVGRRNVGTAHTSTIVYVGVPIENFGNASGFGTSAQFFTGLLTYANMPAP